MSRIAKKSVIVPIDVNISFSGQSIIVKKENNVLSCIVNKDVLITYVNNHLIFKSKENSSKGWSRAGTSRSLVNSMIIGVTTGFSKKLKLFGVGYRVTIVNANVVHMSLGYSHVIKYYVPKGIIVECPSQVEIIIKGINKQLVGQVAANIRSYRVPEPYKGKGIRYNDEVVRIKEAKKK
ncbi:50S ribosomal protein L6 [Buchnera aphidicola]|uniref:50S ribosomal protein L6 n=1 Tax=Buchnera aphidicola subsp. Melaphis rhois TaxID=118103 RepID=A0A4D6YGJ6_BUCMH|nr:50S ribosomal protein L6 [Buchnera aphidicola]QCI23465.1 50S ribosomal protein L6 [Buchnera aphidicola (Melaphis rhois)]